MPKISVVIPVYNKDKYIKNTIQSVLNQSFKDFELLVVNDGSTDNSVKIIQSFNDPRIRFFSQNNQGVAVARNFGVDKANAKLIAFLDGDDIWLSNHLDEIWQLYQKFPEAAFFATAYQIKYKKHIQKYVYNFEQKQVMIDKFYRYDHGRALFFMSNFAVKKDIFVKTGGLKIGIHAEDTEFFLRLGSRYPMAYSRQITMMHLDATDNSLFAQYKLEEKIRLLDFFSNQEKNDPELKTHLDMHRFIWTIEYLLAGKPQRAKALKNTIDFKNLNNKQKILMHLPTAFLKKIIQIQHYLKRKGLFLTPFSK